MIFEGQDGNSRRHVIAQADKSFREAAVWQDFKFRGRDFRRGTVPKGDNKGLTFTIARRLAERYEVKTFFASGGCGLLLEGRDLQTEAKVLIKTTLRYDVASYVRDEQGFTERLKGPRKQLQTERRIMVLLKNQGCNSIPNPNDYVFDWNPQLSDPISDKDPWRYDDEDMLSTEPYLIMERVEGRPVTDSIGRGMPEAQALAIMLQVANVLARLHKPVQRDNRTWQLVYQDLKPDNILLGPHDAASLVDLGGCRLMIGNQVGLNGAFTPGYCPPECGSADKFTPAVDSYALGATMFHMLTGRHPSEYLSSSAAVGGPQHVSFRNWDWVELKRRVRPSVLELIQECLAEKSADRPADGEAVARRITNVLALGTQ